MVAPVLRRKRKNCNKSKVSVDYLGVTDQPELP